MTRSGHRTSIVVLARFPRLGEVKTRLVPPLSAEEALELYDRLARHSVDRARALHATGEARVEVRTDAAYPKAAADWLGVPGLRYRYQGEGDLGDKLRAAFAERFMRGDDRVLVMGADCPRLGPEHLRDALRRLDGADVVLGPAVDGGYYLIALRREARERAVDALFRNIPWGSAEVLSRTQDACERAGLSYALTERLADVDRAEDVADAQATLALDAAPAPGAKVSAIIPVLDDEALVGDAVRAALAGGVCEVLVVDGGSRDGSREVARAAGARVIADAPRGRAWQLNAGAAEATGDILLFTHADTLVPPGAAALARSTLATPGTVAGAFGFAVDPRSRYARTLTLAGRVRASVTGHPHGDQGLFVSARTLRDLGGYPPIPTMEDWELVRRLKRLGRVALLAEPAITSARAWEEHGLIWPTTLNAAVIAAYRAGVDPETLASWRSRIAPGTRSGRREG